MCNSDWDSCRLLPIHINILTSDNSMKTQPCVVLSEMSGLLLYMVIKPNRPDAWPQGRVVRTKLNNMDSAKPYPTSVQK